MSNRTVFQKAKDLLTFPLRALVLLEHDRFGLSSLASERFDYAGREVRGYCLDVGCGRYNRFISEYMNGKGVGIDVYKHKGLTEENVVDDISHFPFDDHTFDTVTFIANINHVPRSLRDIELAEAYRCLKHGGNIVITMGNPLAEILVHKLVTFYDRFFATKYDLDAERGMHEEEEYYLTNSEIEKRLNKACFINIRKKYFGTQMFLNHLFVAEKE